MPVTVGDLLKQLLERATTGGTVKECVAAHILPSFAVTGDMFSATVTCVEVVDRNGSKDITYEEYVIRSNVMGFEHIEKAVTLGTIPKLRFTINQYGLVVGVDVVEEDVTEELVKRLEGSTLVMKGTIIGGREVMVDLGGIRIRYSPLVPTNIGSRIRALYQQGVSQVDIVILPDPSLKPAGRTIRVTRAIVLNRPEGTAAVTRVESAAELVSKLMEMASQQRPEVVDEGKGAEHVEEERGAEERPVEEEELPSEEEIREIEKELEQIV